MLPLILLAVLRADDPPVTPDVLFRTFVQYAALPALAAWLLGRAAAATVTVRDATLCVRRPGLPLEVPCASIAQVSPWAVPLPGPGLALRLALRGTAALGPRTRDPQPLLEGLERAGVVAARTAIAHPLIVWAHAERRSGGRGSRTPSSSSSSLPCSPRASSSTPTSTSRTAGTSDSTTSRDCGRTCRTFAVYWVTVAIYLVLYAAVWRALGEGVALVAAGRRTLARGEGATSRRDRLPGRVYYAGVPALVAAALRSRDVRSRHGVAGLKTESAQPMRS